MIKEEVIQIIEKNPYTYLMQILRYRRDKQFDIAVSYIQSEIGCDREVAEQSALYFFNKNTHKCESTTVTCPYCKSIDTKKISGTSRFMSTGVFGLASSKVGKQWHCNSCKSDF